MTTGQKIYSCRKASGMTQEELAERLGVTRQAVSRWEQDITFPETKQIMELCKLFRISSDELLFGDAVSDEKADKEKTYEEEDGEGKTWGIIAHSGFRFEYISKRRVLGMPLLHVNIGLGARARGIFAIGLVSVGFISVGLLSVGFLSCGVLAIGLLVFGSIVLGGVALGGVAVGLFAAGGVAIGILSLGGVAIGDIAVGGLSIGQYAMGDWAYGWLSVGTTHVEGAHTFLVPEALTELEEFLDVNVGSALGGFIRAVASAMRN